MPRTSRGLSRQRQSSLQLKYFSKASGHGWLSKSHLCNMSAWKSGGTYERDRFIVPVKEILSSETGSRNDGIGSGECGHSDRGGAVNRQREMAGRASRSRRLV